MTDPNNGAPAPQYPASNGTPDANNPAEPNTAAPQYGAPAPAYGQLSGNPYGQPAYGQEQPARNRLPPTANLRMASPMAIPTVSPMAHTAKRRPPTTLTPRPQPPQTPTRFR